uniref:ribonuclease H2 subunit A-like isoform X2 n=1 Tax=Ciona intestinalis TaxID=7719 RepID=UPI000EF47926|nr:ribonuclease H2 subunit A-like isoform X2 [Ciona intestinalis]|eukprot:XP_026694301.1 ribonuclease H2 subunit A-like isoform X2 [Ciona intestinalis]
MPIYFNHILFKFFKQYLGLSYLLMEIEHFLNNCDENFKLKSDIPKLLTSEPCCLGIDEAGRGPVLDFMNELYSGPMVYASCFTPISCKDKLAGLGCDDSKVLKEEQRESLFETLNKASEYIGWMIHILSPAYISTSMLGRSKYNLNSISHDTAIDLIRSALKLGVEVTEVYVDTVGPPQTYAEKLKKIFPSIKFTVEKKADSKYPVVSAASICAKVCRDKAVKEWRFRENPDTDTKYGSGYPADPVTKVWLRNNVDRIFGFPSFVRFSWSTINKNETDSRRHTSGVSEIIRRVWRLNIPSFSAQKPDPKSHVSEQNRKGIN